jgi:hypothetical protein
MTIAAALDAASGEHDPVSKDRVVIRFAGDSGDGMQLAGDRFTSETAAFGNDLSTLPKAVWLRWCRASCVKDEWAINCSAARLCWSGAGRWLIRPTVALCGSTVRRERRGSSC